MRYLSALLVALNFIAILSGCQQIQLRNHALRQASTLSELQCRQVLSNLAMFIDNPNSLPYFSITGTGLTNITNGATAGGSLSWDKQFNAGKALSFYFDKAGATFGGSSMSGEQWTTASTLNPDELLLMRCVYQMTVGAPSCNCDCEKKAKTFFETTPCYLEAMHPGWFYVGHWCDVPKSASYVGHFGNTFVWVMPEGVDSLTKLTLSILDIATSIKPGEVGNVNPIAAKIKALTEKAKDLTQILDKYPKPQVLIQTPSPVYTAVKEDLDNTLRLLEALSNGYTPEDILKGEKEVTVPTVGNGNTVYRQDVIPSIPKVETRKRQEFAAQLGRILSTPSDTQGATRDRKNFYNPLQQPIIPPQ